MVVPEAIKRKYPRKGRLTFPDGSVEVLNIPKAVFVADHNPEREYWKGFELIEWDDGVIREVRVCYWTRKRGTDKWIWGQFNTIISLEKLKQLMRMLNKE